MIYYATVRSEPEPQSGQKHRSSDNFSVKGCENSLEWVIPEGIRVDIKEDKRFGVDPTHFTGVRNGQITDSPMSSKLYIANPSGASQPFDVSCNCVTEG